jgi:Ni/Co efflux regulator RcnB
METIRDQSGRNNSAPVIVTRRALGVIIGRTRRNAMTKFLIAAAALAIFAAAPAWAQPGHDDHGKPAPSMSMKGPSMSMKGPSMSMKGPSMSMKGPSMSMKGPGMSGRAHWKRGDHIGRDDWGRGVRIDYREHHLDKPGRGYEWREVDGNFILAAAATGLIASVVLASH